VGDRQPGILIVTYDLPYPTHSGGSVRTFNLIKQISRHYPVSLVCLAEAPAEAEQLQQLQLYCDRVDVVVRKKRPKWQHLPGVARSWLNGWPLEFFALNHDELSAKIHEIADTWGAEVLHITPSYLAPYVESLPRLSKCKKILDFHDVGSMAYDRMYRLDVGVKLKLRFFLRWLLARRWEPKYPERFDVCTVVSTVERQVLKSANPRLNVAVIENGVDTATLQPLPQSSGGNTVVFVGSMLYGPNIDGALYFCNSILPLIRRRAPDVKLVIVGRDPPPQVCALAERGGVTVTGRVPDTVPYYQRSQVSIVPLRGAGGTRLKILESMALGRPVVTTSLGCEGLNVADQENILIADTPARFAERVIQLLTDKDLRDRIAGNARRLVVTQYDWSVIGEKLVSVYDHVVTPQ
jgi:polysaccharide biosynthesis protein PslH